ncbi:MULTISPECIES: hypothetical protein [Kitasatospora]|uniref:Uncharacterized protein n=1 Tax=Kitasatospora setae (strain ATCC 33774 / DSM 43861 / JCM 3304 / KCC A-0304 / NBRC 14216 / KM-6054) TaxID=452652 RepID=E4N6D4_KITSK|nr:MULTISPECIES: hypothetical protein [Kitasatospora]BAJ26765.1 hypothetical protein KSE_09280 [Kitasatospora setae KM-6054]
MPHPRRPSVRLLTRRQYHRRQEPHRRWGRGARRNPLRRGVDRARRRAVALACCVLAAALAAGAAAGWLAPPRLLPAALASGPYRTVDRALLGLLAAGTVAAAGAAGLRWRLRALERRAAEAWERSWRRVEPLWSGRALPWADGGHGGGDGCGRGDGCGDFGRGFGRGFGRDGERDGGR